MADSILKKHQLDIAVGVELNDAQRKATSAQIKNIASQWQDLLDNAIKKGIEDGARSASLRDVLTQFNAQLKAFKLEPLTITVDELQIMDKPIEHAAKLVIQRLGDSFKGGGLGNIISSEITDSLDTIGGTVDKIYQKMEQGAKKSAKNISKSMAEIAEVAGNYTTKKSMSKIDKAISKNPQKGTAEASIEGFFKESVSARKNGASWDKQYLSDVNFVKNYKKIGVDKLKQIFGDQFSQVEKYYNQLAKVHQQKIVALNDILAHNEYIGGSKKNPTQYQFKGEPWAREKTLQEVKSILSGGLTVKGGSDNKSDKLPDSNLNTQKPQKSAQLKLTTYDALRAVEDRGSISRDKSVKNWGGEYWSAGAEDIARKMSQSYAENFYKDGAVIKAEIQPINPLVFDAEGLEWNAFDKILGIKELFPGIVDLMKQSGYIDDDGQKYINDQARAAGFDAVVIDNVNDFFNTNEEGADGELASVIAVLNDNIIKYIGAFEAKQGDDGIVISDKLSNIPDFYTMPEEQNIDQKMSQLRQQQEAYEQWYKNTIERLSTDKSNEAIVESLQKQHDITRANFNASIEQADVKEQSANESLVEEKNITQEIEKQNKLLLYRRGKTSWNPERFRNSDMLGNSILMGNEYNEEAVSKYGYNGAIPSGFGGFGDGLYASTISGASDLITGLSDKESYFEIDASKYKMYINETEEQAEKMKNFLLTLQKFVLAAGDFRGFDGELENVNEQSLFAEAGSIFEAFNMSQEEFAIWLRSMKQIVTDHGLDARGVWTKNVDDKFLNSHNFGTRFMQSMGYEGVVNYTGNEELDGNGEGSVIFDPKFDELKEQIESSQHKWTNNDDFEDFIEKEVQAIQKETEAYIKQASAIVANTQAKRDNMQVISKQNNTLEKLNEVKNQNTDVDDDDEIIAKENGQLEDKLELLRDIAEEYGKDISQKQRNAYERLNQKEMDSGLTPKEDDRYYELGEQIDEADDALDRFGETYDKIILKLENGKKVEILPDDKGLRSLYKFSDEYGDTYNGVEIEDIIYQRVEKEAVAHQENTATIIAETRAVDELSQSLKAKDAIESSDINKSEIAAEKAETDVINQQNEALKENIDLKAQANAQDNGVSIDINAKPDITKPSAGSTEVKTSINTEELRGLLNSITYNVKVIQDAEPAEDNKVSIDESALESVLNRITYNVKIVYDDNDKTANKIAIDEGVLEQTLKRVFTNVLNPNTEQNDLEPKNEPWALESTLNTTIKGVLDQIQMNTAKIDTVSQTPVNDSDSTLGVISKNVQEINTKVVKGTKPTTFKPKTGGTKKPAANTLRPVAFSPERKETTKMSLEKLKMELKASGRLTDELQKKFTALSRSLGNTTTGAGLAKWNEKFKQFKLELGTDTVQNKGLQKQAKELGAWQAKAEKENTQEAQNHVAELQRKIQEQQTLLGLTKEERDILAQITEETKQSTLNTLNDKQADKDAKKAAADAKKEMQKQAMLGKAGNAVGRAEGVYIEAEGLDKSQLPKDFEKRLETYYNAFEELRDTQTNLSKAKFISEDDKKNLREQINNVNGLTNELGELISQYQRLSGDNVKELGANTLGPDASLSDYKQQLTSLVTAHTNGKAQIKSFDNETKILTYTVKNAKNETTTYTATLRGLDKQFVAVQGSTKKTETFFEATIRKMKEISSYMSGMTILSRLGQELRRGIQYVREIDSALVELRKVTDETDETYDRFLKTAAKTGARIGSTISEVTEATATFSKLGYEIKSATEMAESALVYKNVGDNIASAEDAADSIISTLKGFKLEASESMRIVDRFNEVGNRFAITSQGIGEALRLSASALSEGGNSLDESIGLITAANEVVNDPSSVGTALKTLTLRLRGSKTELEEMGEDVSDMATTTSSLQAKLLALTGGQVDIMLNETTFKNSTQILREMADAWGDMNDIQRASALELMGGKRQANVLSALIQNFDTVESAIEASANSAGKQHCPSVQKCA